jgi:hypothetical protein
MKILFVWLLLATSAFAQIQVTPPESNAHDPITATLSNPIPEGAQVQGGWQLPTAKSEPAPEGLHIWAKPGTHTVSYRGVWIKTVPVTLADGTVVQVLEGFGFLDESATFTVKGGDDDDDDPDPPPPPPVTRLGVVIVEDAEARTSLPYGQVQSMTLPDLREIPERFRLVDKDNPAPGLAPWIALARSHPWLILHDVASGRVVWQGVVPSTAADMRALLNKYKPQDAVQRAIEQKADPKATITPARPQAAPVKPQTVFGRIRR